MSLGITELCLPPPRCSLIHGSFYGMAAVAVACGGGAHPWLLPSMACMAVACGGGARCRPWMRCPCCRSCAWTMGLRCQTGPRRYVISRSLILDESNTPIPPSLPSPSPHQGPRLDVQDAASLVQSMAKRLESSSAKAGMAAKAVSQTPWPGRRRSSRYTTFDSHG